MAHVDGAHLPTPWTDPATVAILAAYSKEHRPGFLRHTDTAKQIEGVYTNRPRLHEIRVNRPRRSDRQLHDRAGAGLNVSERRALMGLEA